MGIKSNHSCDRCQLTRCSLTLTLALTPTVAIDDVEVVVVIIKGDNDESLTKTC